MKFWVAITDMDWYRYLAARPELDEVNFWQPSAGRRPVRLEPGAPVLFKLRSRFGGWIVGGGFFVHYIVLPIPRAWDTFGDENGTASLGELVARTAGLRAAPVNVASFDIGCSVLSEPFYWDRKDWLPAPDDWSRNTQVGKSFDSEAEGRELWEAIRGRLAAMPSESIPVAEDRYGRPILVRPRLGQGGFRSVVIDAYERRCVVTGERTLPALDAAHIRPYRESGPHLAENGLLLRKDLHALFDDGYVTITTDLEFRVSRQIRERFENGRDYYALDRRRIRLPAAGYPPPGEEFIKWHNERFLG